MTDDSNLSTTAKRIVERLYKKYVNKSRGSSFSSDASLVDFTRYLARFSCEQEDTPTMNSFAMDSVLFIGGETSDADLLMDLWTDEIRTSEEAEVFDSVSYYDLAR